MFIQALELILEVYYPKVITYSTLVAKLLIRTVLTIIAVLVFAISLIKINSKILANKLKKVLPKVIFPLQEMFIQG